MSGKLLTTGRAGRIRAVLLLFPEGATAAQVHTAGDFDCNVIAVNDALAAMRRAELVSQKVSGAQRLWRLTPRTVVLMRRAEQAAKQKHATAARRAPAPVDTAAFASTSIQRKDLERAQLKKEMDEFKRRGGRVQVLGNTPIRKDKTYRASQSGIAR